MDADADAPPWNTSPEAPSLDPQETAVGSQPSASSGSPDGRARHEIIFRHSGWSARRARVLAALNRIEAGSDRTLRFEGCGSHAWIYRDAENADRLCIKADYCHDRFCVPCQNARNLRLRGELMNFAQGKTLRFITLTIATPGMPLANAIDKLLVSFRRLRESKLWKAHVTGGVAVLEVKRSSRSPRWHPHLHILAEGSFIPQRALSQAWRAITRSSFIVDVRFVGDATKAAEYVTKYVTKPIAAHVHNADALLDEAIIAMKGRRTLVAFGTWYGHNFFRHLDTTEWIALAPLNRIIAEALAGDRNSCAILSLVTVRTPPEHSRGPPADNKLFGKTPL